MKEMSEVKAEEVKGKGLKPREGRKIVAHGASHGIRRKITRSKPREGRKKFDVESLSPLSGLRNFIYALGPRADARGYFLPPLAGLNHITFTPSLSAFLLT
jgi:hypothetical protein